MRCGGEEVRYGGRRRLTVVVPSTVLSPHSSAQGGSLSGSCQSPLGATATQDPHHTNKSAIQIVCTAKMRVNGDAAYVVS